MVKNLTQGKRHSGLENCTSQSLWVEKHSQEWKQHSQWVETPLSNEWKQYSLWVETPLSNEWKQHSLWMETPLPNKWKQNSQWVETKIPNSGNHTPYEWKQHPLRVETTFPMSENMVPEKSRVLTDTPEFNLTQVWIMWKWTFCLH